VISYCLTAPQRRVEQDVDEDAAAGQVDADWQPVREVADGAPLAAVGRDVRQLLGCDAGQRRQVVRLVVGGAQPDHLRVLDDGVQHHQPMDGLAER
jgi:hypothetical protein